MQMKSINISKVALDSKKHLRSDDSLEFENLPCLDDVTLPSMSDIARTLETLLSITTEHQNNELPNPVT
eukprot:5335755-Amphidinium_carterae.1